MEAVERYAASDDLSRWSWVLLEKKKRRGREREDFLFKRKKAGKTMVRAEKNRMDGDWLDARGGERQSSKET